MKNAEKQDRDPNQIRELFFSEKEIPWEQVFESEENLKEFMACEETLVALFEQNSTFFEKDAYFAFRETLDIAKAELLLDGKHGHPLPDFLKHYTETNLAAPEKKDTLIVRLSQKGIQLIDSLLESVKIQESFDLAPVLRASADTIPQDTNSVIFEETTAENQRFYYQIVKETPEEVYLSVKAETNQEGRFHQVNLRKDGRFILSSKISLEGTASFSGLKPGNYSIEFLGNGKSKSFDLSVLVG
ncbi:hypothetical protein [Leptospira idonii]|uniref:Uncharacterized protein n=1 Tax=Leptospira idonii TaxID=1193500 RepID=A0A4R9LZ55_9LEPT|nr:hypothetical protein [Leptospira idonii]TGN18901.1 hypothetical protein EHS15_10805 [Leptospira idonii]